MPTSSTLNGFHNLFDQSIVQGFILIQDDVNFIFNFLCVLVIATTSIMTWAWGDTSTAIRGLIQKILLLSFVGLLLSNWHTYTSIIVQGMTSLGLKAGGSSMAAATFWNEPSQIFLDGFNLSQKIWKSCAGCSGIPTLSGLSNSIVFLFGALWIMIAFAWLAISVFVATIEFKIVTLAGMVFVPFAIWPKMSFLSERALGYVFSCGAKMMTLALVIALGEQSLANLPVISATDWSTLYYFCGLSAALLFLAISSSKLAAALVSGGPELGVSSTLEIGKFAGDVAVGAGGFALGAATQAGAAMNTAAGSALTHYRAATTAANLTYGSNAAESISQSTLAAAAKAYMSPSSFGDRGFEYSGPAPGAPIKPPPDARDGGASPPAKGPSGSNGTGPTNGANDGDASPATAHKQVNEVANASVAVANGNEAASFHQATASGRQIEANAQALNVASITDGGSSLQSVSISSQYVEGAPGAKDERQNSDTCQENSTESQANTGSPISGTKADGYSEPWVQSDVASLQDSSSEAVPITAPSYGGDNTASVLSGGVSSSVLSASKEVEPSDTDGMDAAAIKRSYTTGGGRDSQQSTIRKISDEQRKIEGESTGSRGAPDVHSEDWRQ